MKGSPSSSAPEPHRSLRQDISRQPDIGSPRAPPSAFSFSEKLPRRPNILSLSSLAQTAPVTSQNSVTSHPAPKMSNGWDESYFKPPREILGLFPRDQGLDNEGEKQRLASSSRLARNALHQPSAMRLTAQSRLTSQSSSSRKPVSSAFVISLKCL